ncbi:MAG: glutamate--tRNA ligase [Hadesarchaea archaeon]|nr:glutamate--tRNA ligase [Hadesarchaea archaeon]
MDEIRSRALRWALSNALEHEGKADLKAVLGKLMAEVPELRARAKEIRQIVEPIIDEVNRLSPEEQLAKLEELGPLGVAREREARGLPELPDVDRYPKVVTRFAPNPNGPLHIGHVRAALLSHEYARMYGGKFILRFEDTNPANALLEMYDLIRLDLRWLGIEWGEEYVQSDRLEIYYRYAEELIAGGKAYVCTCDAPTFKRLRDRGEPCPCRGLPADEQLGRWRGMLGGEFGEEEAVVRIKTDLRHPNPAVRDWPALRVVTTPHPRVGRRYRVWPLYNFSVAIDDHEMGVTHVIRGKEHLVNEMRQKTLFEHLGWIPPAALQYGRLTMAGATLSKTQTVKGVKEGKFSGYDDPRLATIAALRRRGFSPEAIRQVILDLGLTPVDAALSWETLCAYNRRLIDARANRYFFVASPVKLVVQGVPEIDEVRLRLHPSHPERGERVLPLLREGDVLTAYLAGEDASRLEVGEVFRLKDLMNVELRSKGPPLEGDFRGLELVDVPKLQWVSAGGVEVEVLMPDAGRVLGLAEPAVAGLAVGEVVQFERFGFVRVDALRPKIIAVYGHR